jgi:hypothetical protein
MGLFGARCYAVTAWLRGSDVSGGSVCACGAYLGAASDLAFGDVRHGGRIDLLDVPVGEQLVGEATRDP